jgi:hypothetical protein
MHACILLSAVASLLEKLKLEVKRQIDLFIEDAKDK